MITLSAANVSKTFRQVNIHKAAGTYRLPGRVLRACTDQLASVFTDIFHLSESVIPTCFFKQTTVVPVPKNTKVMCLNDYRPVALTSVAMKHFERLAMAHINNIIPVTLDPLQFAYMAHNNTTIPETLDPLQLAYHLNTSSDEAISTTLLTALSHLDKRNIHVRMLFLAYSPVFNTKMPTKLITKLRTLGPRLDPKGSLTAFTPKP